MTWRLVATEDLERVQELYQGVFQEHLSKDTIERRRGKQPRFHLYLVRGDDNTDVGFGIFTGVGDEVDFWHGGVLPAYRRGGAGTFLLEAALLDGPDPENINCRQHQYDCHDYYDCPLHCRAPALKSVRRIPIALNACATATFRS